MKNMALLEQAGQIRRRSSRSVDLMIKKLRDNKDFNYIGFLQSNARKGNFDASLCGENARRQAWMKWKGKPKRKWTLNRNDFLWIQSKIFADHNADSKPSIYEKTLTANGKAVEASPLNFENIQTGCGYTGWIPDSIAPDDFILSLPGFMPNSIEKVWHKVLLPTWGGGESSKFYPDTQQIEINIRNLQTRIDLPWISPSFMKAILERDRKTATEDLQGNGQGAIQLLAEKNPLMAAGIRDIIHDKSPEVQDKEMFAYFVHTWWTGQYHNKSSRMGEG